MVVDITRVSRIPGELVHGQERNGSLSSAYTPVRASVSVVKSIALLLRRRGCRESETEGYD